MSVRACRVSSFSTSVSRTWFLRRLAVLVLICCIGIAAAQVELPEVVVRAAKPKPQPKPTATARPGPGCTRSCRTAADSAPVHGGGAACRQDNCPEPGTQHHLCAHRHHSDDDQPRHDPGTAQGDNQTVEKIVLQLPGVTQDSAASGSFHVRNEHANVQVRINGIMLPDGVTGFGTFLDTALIGNISLITGALPAQFGLRTSGVLDI